MKITTTKQQIAGIDISKLTLDICSFDTQTSQQHETRVSNNTEGFAGLGKWPGAQGFRRSQTLLVSEHTGRYGEQLLRWSTENGWPHRGKNHRSNKSQRRTSPQI
jgi:transposase